MGESGDNIEKQYQSRSPTERLGADLNLSSSWYDTWSAMNNYLISEGYVPDDSTAERFYRNTTGQHDYLGDPDEHPDNPGVYADSARLIAFRDLAPLYEDTHSTEEVVRWLPSLYRVVLGNGKRHDLDFCKPNIDFRYQPCLEPVCPPRYALSYLVERIGALHESHYHESTLGIADMRKFADRQKNLQSHALIMLTRGMIDQKTSSSLKGMITYGPPELTVDPVDQDDGKL